MEVQTHDTKGIHIIMELSGCPQEVLGDIDYIEKTLSAAAVAAHTTILDLTCHRFSPTGVSGVAVVAESHISIHTWPETGYAAVDIYTCGKSVDPREGCICISKLLQAEQVCCTSWERGLLEEGGRYVHSQIGLDL